MKNDTIKLFEPEEWLLEEAVEISELYFEFAKKLDKAMGESKWKDEAMKKLFESRCQAIMAKVEHLECKR